jgi:Putative zinc- or iron-chelating domain
MRRLTKQQISQTQLSLPQLYDLTERALSGLPKPPCAARTCHGCCWSPPTITDAEFAHIQEHVQLHDIKPAAEPWCRFYDEKTGGCQIYSVRPLECRLVAVLDQYRFNCCAPAAQPELMPEWALPLRELLYRALYQLNEKPGETHISTLFDRAVRKMEPPTPARRIAQVSLRSKISRSLLRISFVLVRMARRITKPGVAVVK